MTEIIKYTLEVSDGPRDIGGRALIVRPELTPHLVDAFKEIDMYKSLGLLEPSLRCGVIQAGKQSIVGFSRVGQSTTERDLWIHGASVIRAAGHEVSGVYGPFPEHFSADQVVAAFPNYEEAYRRALANTQK